MIFSDFSGRECRGDFAEPFEDRLANNFIAVFAFESSRAEKRRSHVVALISRRWRDRR